MHLRAHTSQNVLGEHASNRFLSLSTDNVPLAQCYWFAGHIGNSLFLSLKTYALKLLLPKNVQVNPREPREIKQIGLSLKLPLPPGVLSKHIPGT